MRPEIYKDVLGYEGLYQVSDQGNVMRVNGGQGAKSGMILRSRLDAYGYYIINLCLKGIKKTHKVHRLVALTFLSNTENKKQVNHIDGVKTNNSPSNLEWCTAKENHIHSRDVLGNQYGVKGEKHHNYGKFLGDNKNAVGVIQYDLNGNEIARFTSIRGASIATGASESHIPTVCRGRQQTAGGYRWKYI